METLLKTVKQEQLNQIRELSLQVWPKTFNSILSDDQIDYMIEMMYSETSLQQQYKDGCEFYIVYHQNVPAGFMSLQHSYKQNPNITKLHKLYLLEEFQKIGLGKWLINSASEIAVAQRSTILELNVNRYNTKAIEFYKKMKFETTSTEDIAIGNNFLMEDFVMQKPLQS